MGSNPGSSSSCSEPDSDAESEYGSGDGESLDEELEGGNGGTWKEIAGIIAKAQRRNIRHEAAEVARSAIPFEDRNEADAFLVALQHTLSSRKRPDGYQLDDEYESSESYKTGRSSTPLVIPLPYDVWFPRIVVWCKALDLLKRFFICRDVM